MVENGEHVTNVTSICRGMRMSNLQAIKRAADTKLGNSVGPYLDKDTVVCCMQLRGQKSSVERKNKHCYKRYTNSACIKNLKMCRLCAENCSKNSLEFTTGTISS